MSEPTRPPTPALQAWVSYSKDRLDALDAQLRDFRASARQLITVIGLIVGLELTLGAKILFDIKPIVGLLWAACVLGLMGTVIFQLRILFKLLLVGFGREPVPSPGSPEDFWSHITNDEHAIVREIGIHYATSYNALRNLSDKVATELEHRSRSFGYSLAALGILVALSGILAFATAQQPTLPLPATTETPLQPAANMNRRQAMPTDDKPQPPPPTADQNTSAQPAATTAAPVQQSTSPVGAMPAPTVRMDTQRFSAQRAQTSGLPVSQVRQDEIMKVLTKTPAPPPKKKD